MEHNGEHGLRPGSAGDDAADGFAVPAEPDFASFQAVPDDPLLPRWLQAVLLGLAGFASMAAIMGAGMLVARERAADRMLQMVAVHARAGAPSPVQPDAVVPAVTRDEPKVPTEATPAATPHAATPPAATPPAATPPAATPPAATPTVATPPVATRPAATTSAATTPAATVPAAQPGANTPPGPRAKKAVAAKSKPRAGANANTRRAIKSAAKKKHHKRKQPAALARRASKRKAPPPRTPTLAQRLDAAIAACRARPHAPGECNLRACDVAAKSDPACR